MLAIRETVLPAPCGRQSECQRVLPEQVAALSRFQFSRNQFDIPQVERRRAVELHENRQRLTLRQAPQREYP